MSEQWPPLVAESPPTAGIDTGEKAVEEQAYVRGATVEVALDASHEQPQPQPRSARGIVSGLTSSTALWVALVDVLMIGLFTILSHNNVFFSVSNFQNIAISASEILLLALGEVYLLGAGEFDISLGANLVLSSVVAAKVMLALEGTQTATGGYPHAALAIVVGLAAGIGAGGAIGLINGLIVTRLRVNSLLTTLAMFGAAIGAADLLANGGDLTGIPSGVQTHFGSSQPAGIPLPSVLVALVLLLGWFVLAKTRFGLHTLALGSSRETARRAGLNVSRHVVVLFIAAGLLAGLAGMIDLSRFATTNIAGHANDSLVAIAGAVIGGTALFGGRASVAGAVVGTLFSVILEIGLVILNVSAFYQPIATGVVLILAVSLDQMRRPGTGGAKRRQ